MSKSFWMKEQNGKFSNGKIDTFNKKNRYIGLRMQQGVPLLDRDINEQEDIRRYAEMNLRKYYIGDGSPDDGFKIVPCDPAANDFKILPGRMLIQGFEIENFSETSYLMQPNVPVDRISGSLINLTIPTVARKDIVYLEMWIEEVTSAENEALGNSQDIKIETSIRHQIQWRVFVDEGNMGYTLDPYHRCYPIAEIDRIADAASITINEITDTRQSNSFEELKDDFVFYAENHEHIIGDGGQIKHTSLEIDDWNNPHNVAMSQLADLDATGRSVTNLAEPVYGDSAATKDYVDNVTVSIENLNTTVIHHGGTIDPSSSLHISIEQGDQVMTDHAFYLISVFSVPAVGKEPIIEWTEYCNTSTPPSSSGGTAGWRKERGVKITNKHATDTVEVSIQVLKLNHRPVAPVV